MSHYEERLEKDLNEIRRRVRAMSQAVQAALANALSSLLTGDPELAYRTVLKDAHINEAMRTIDGLCHRLIARHLPSAGHLRLMSAVIRTALQLERLGDYAVIIAREGVQLSARPPVVTARQLDMTMDTALRMLRQALDAFNDGNEERARATMGMGASMETIMDRVYADILDVSESARTKDILALFVVFNHVKRIADVAKNVCEETLFATTGEIKSSRVHDVLFVDANHAVLGPMAAAIAQRAHPNVARFSSAAPAPAQQVNAGVKQFLTERGFVLPTTAPKHLDASPEWLSGYFLVVCLDAPVESYLPAVPFHTSAFAWPLEAPDAALQGDAQIQAFETIYRELSTRIEDLAEMLSGREAP